MNKIAKIWEELDRKNGRVKGTKLSAKKRGVKLGAVDEARNLYDDLEDAQSLLSYFGDEVIDEQDEKLYEILTVIDEYIINSGMMNAKDYAEDMEMYLNKIEESAKSLGIDPDEIYEDYQDAKDLVDATYRSHEDMVDAFNSSKIQYITSFANQIKR